ncbi:MAG: inositol 2-dehydrogenase [Caulobacteraceae bacterium]|nr:inositol 2-dehydrogenase [Caulobacteraceae bacterium]
MCQPLCEDQEPQTKGRSAADGARRLFDASGLAFSPRGLTGHPPYFGTVVPKIGTLRVDLQASGMSRLRVIVVGMGFMGLLHARAVRGLRSAELVGVVDLNETAATTAGESLGVPAFTDLAQAIRESRAQAAIIATPDPSHRRPTEVALDAGLAVLVEKPLATTVEDAQAMTELARRQGARLMTGHLFRFDARYAQAAETIRSGRLGKPFLFTARHWSTRSLGARVGEVTSPLWHFSIHHIDAIQWISGASIESIDGAQALASAGGSSAFLAIGALSSGAGFQISTGWTLPDTGGRSTEFEAHCERGVVRITFAPGGGLALWDETRGHEVEATAWPLIHGRIEGLLRREIEHFVEAVLDGTDFVITPEDAIAAISSAVALENASIRRTAP